MPDFLQHTRARGLVIEHVQRDGKIHRVPVEGKPKTDKTGWYAYHAGGNRDYAVYGRWDDGQDDGTWFSDSGKKLSDTERKQIQETKRAIGEQKEKGYAKAAQAVQKLFDAADEVEMHPYLEKKAVKAFGLKSEGESLLIPLRDAAGVLWSLQRILPNGDKRFHPGGKINGCFHWLGNPDDANWLLLAEGYATAASIHEATGMPVAAAMNCGNMLPVGKAIVARWPNAKILICADDDKATEAKIGKNPGIAAAREAVKELNKGQAAGSKRARYVAPEGKEGYGSDFNDLAVSSGLDTVHQQIEAAIGKKPARKLEVLPKKESTKGNNNGSGSGSDYPRTRFTVDDTGVFYHGVDKNGNQLSPFWICSSLHITARTRDGDSNGWGSLLEFPDYDGMMHQWLMSASLLAGDGKECRSNLLSMGLRISSSNAAKSRLLEYIQSVHTDTRVLCADKIGWYNGTYVLPDRCIGSSNEKVVFQNPSSEPNTFKQNGTVEEWKKHIGQYCVGNSRLVFVVSAAFAGALLDIAGLESGGFHFKGGSAIGKTGAFYVASSVWGKKFMEAWLTTGNALESVAARHSDSVLVLDEISMVDPKEVGNCAYLLANGIGKRRSTSDSRLRPALTWRLIFLSSGEKSLSEHMAEAGKRPNAGMEVRICEIAGDAGAGYGLFENLHGFQGGKEFHDWLKDQSTKYYGQIGITYLEELTKRYGKLRDRIKHWQGVFLDGLIPAGASSQVTRGASRFAIVAAAGEIASELNLTGWKQGEAVKAAQACFKSWLDARGGIAPTEEVQMWRQVRLIIETSDGLFAWPSRKGDDRGAQVLNRLGYKRMYRRDGTPHDYQGNDDPIRRDELDTHYFVTPEAFKQIVCKGFDYKAVAKLLRAKGALVTESGRLTVSTSFANKKERFYHINPIALYDNDDDLTDKPNIEAVI